MNNTDLLFTVLAQVPFWTSGQSKPLIVVVILPLSHVPSYTRPWVVKGTDEGERAECTLQRGFKMGEPDDTGEFHELDSSCAKCGKIQRAGHSLFCRNFLLGRATFPLCRNVWSGECYRESSNGRFPRLDNLGETINANDLEIEVSPTLGRYRCGRNGDHLMGVPFECNLCLFRNVCKREPEFKNKRNQFTLTTIRRSQLDMMWAREPHTVATNWARAKADYGMTMRYLSVLSEYLFPQLGSVEVRDQVVMAEALTTLVTSLRPGRNSTNIQWETMRKMRTWLSDARDAGRKYSCETVVGMDREKQHITVKLPNMQVRIYIWKSHRQ
jgi:hypothetical protein